MLNPQDEKADLRKRVEELLKQTELNPNLYSAETQKELKKAFSELKPFVTREHIYYFYDWFKKSDSTKPIFDDDEDNIALWTYIKAYGLGKKMRIVHTEGVADEEILNIPLSTDVKKYITPIFPKSPLWPGITHLQKTVRASPYSRRITAYFFVQGDNVISEVIIVGNGIHDITVEVESAAFSSYLGINPKDSDFILSGIIRLSGQKQDDELTAETRETKEEKKKLKSFAGFFKGIPEKRAEPKIKMFLDIPESAQESLELLKGTLDRLQSDSGFADVRIVPLDTLKKINERIVRLNQESALSKNALVVPPIKQNDDLIAIIDYMQIPWLAGRLRLQLPLKLIKTPLYSRLSNAYEGALISRMLIDAERRETFYRERITHYKESIKEWKSKSLKEQTSEPPVKITHSIDFVTGLMIALPKPETRSASKWHNEIEPENLKLAEEWLERVIAMKNRIRELSDKENAPLRRLLANKLIQVSHRSKYQ